MNIFVTYLVASERALWFHVGLVLHSGLEYHTCLNLPIWISYAGSTSAFAFMAFLIVSANVQAPSRFYVC